MLGVVAGVFAGVDAAAAFEDVVAVPSSKQAQKTNSNFSMLVDSGGAPFRAVSTGMWVKLCTTLCLP